LHQYFYLLGHLNTFTLQIKYVSGVDILVVFQSKKDGVTTAILIFIEEKKLKKIFLYLYLNLIFFFFFFFFFFFNYEYIIYLLNNNELIYVFIFIENLVYY